MKPNRLRWSVPILFTLAACNDGHATDADCESVAACVESYDPVACEDGCVLCEDLPERVGSAFMTTWLACAPAALRGSRATELQSASVGHDGLARAWELRFRSQDQSQEGTLRFAGRQLRVEVPSMQPQTVCPPITPIDSETIVPDAIDAFDATYGDQLAMWTVRPTNELELLVQQDCRVTPGYPLVLVTYATSTMFLSWTAWFGSVDSGGALEEWRGPCSGTDLVRRSPTLCDPLPQPPVAHDP